MSQRPKTERGHLYVKLARGLLVRRRLRSLDQGEEADVAAQLQQLWDGMDEAEQARVEAAVGARAAR